MHRETRPLSKGHRTLSVHLNLGSVSQHFAPPRESPVLSLLSRWLFTPARAEYIDADPPSRDRPPYPRAITYPDICD